MYICICNGVTDRDIREAADAGVDSLDALREELGVASCCGTCACAAEALLQNEDGQGRTASPARGSNPLTAALPAGV